MSRIKGGFSLIEILLVLALIALASTLFVTNFDAIEKGIKGKRSLDLVISDAIRESRYQALKNHQRVLLSYQKDTQKFVIKNEEGLTFSQFAYEGMSPKDKLEKLEIATLKKGGTFSSYLTAGDSIDAIPFSPDGSALPVAIEARINSKRFSYRTDAFSNELMKNEP